MQYHLMKLKDGVMSLNGVGLATRIYTTKENIEWFCVLGQTGDY